MAATGLQPVSFFGPQALASALSPGTAQQAQSLQMQQQLAQGILGEGLQPLDPTRSAGGWVVPISPVEGLAHSGKALAGALMARNALEGQTKLQQQQMQGMMGLFGGSQNPMSPQSANPSVMAGSGTTQPTTAPQRGPLSMSGNPGQDFMQFAMAPEPYMKKLLDLQGPNSEIGKLLQDAGIDPNSALGKQLIQANIAKTNYVAPTTFRANTPVRDPFDPTRVIAFNPELPAGSIPQFDAQGNVTSVTPVPGASAVMATNAAAQASGPAQFRQERLPGPGGSEIPVTAAQLPRMLGGSQQPQQLPPNVPPQDAGAYNAVRSGQVPAAYGNGPNTLSGQVPQMRTQTTAEQSESKQAGHRLGDYQGDIINKSASAAIANRGLANMESYLQDFDPSKAQGFKSSLAQWAYALVPGMTEQMANEILNTNTSSVEAVNSMMVKLAGQATRQSDSQPSQLQFLKILKATPGALASPDTSKKIIAYMRDLNNMDIEKAAALQDWRRTHNQSADGFETAWAKDISPALPMVWNQQQSSPQVPTGTVPQGFPVLNQGQAKGPAKVMKWSDLGR